MPKRFTAPVSGAYHFAYGREPHLQQDCTDECRATSPAFNMPSGEYRTVEFKTHCTPVEDDAMPDPWTTRAEPGTRDRRVCPLCDWYHDSGDPDTMLPASVAYGVKTLEDATYLIALEHVKTIDAVIRTHLETHSLEEWLRATADLAYLRGTVAIGGLADVPPPDEDRLLGALYAGTLTHRDVRWLEFASAAIKAFTAAMKVVDDV
jgi:hypothetical protein